VTAATARSGTSATIRMRIAFFSEQFTGRMLAQRFYGSMASNASEVQDDKMQNQDDDNDSIHMRSA
jgi:hypothetical protein